MKLFVMLSSVFFANLSFAASQYVPFNNSGSYTCANGEVVSGVRYDDAGNKSLLGIWCSKLPALSEDIESYMSINDGGNGRYDVKCAGQELVSGFDFSDDFDPSSEGMYCKRVENGNHGSSHYLRIEGLRGKRYDVMCRNGAYLSGIKFREGFDDAVIGIHCTFYECADCTIDE